MRPLYTSGLDDDVFRIVAQLRHATGGDFEHASPFDEPVSLDLAQALDQLDGDIDEEEGREDEGSEDEGSEGGEVVQRTS